MKSMAKSLRNGTRNKLWMNSFRPKLISFVADRYPNLGNGTRFKPPAFESLGSQFVE